MQLPSGHAEVTGTAAPAPNPQSVPGERRLIPGHSAGGGVGFGEVWGALGDPCFSSWELGDLQEGTAGPWQGHLGPEQTQLQQHLGVQHPLGSARADVSQGTGLGGQSKHPQTLRGLKLTACALLTRDLRQFINLCSELSAHLQSP